MLLNTAKIKEILRNAQVQKKIIDISGKTWSIYGMSKKTILQEKEKELDNREKRFVKRYPVDLNPEASAIDAGYSKTTAHSKAYQWVSNSKIKPHVYNAIQDELKKRADKVEITAERVLAEYAKLAFLDPGKFYDENGELIPIHKLPNEVAAALTGVDVSEITMGDKTQGFLKKIKFADKKAALDSVAKHLGMFIERSEQKITMENPPVLTIQFLGVNADNKSS